MRVVITNRESIPEWLYPGSFSDLETPASDALDTDLTVDDFRRLWEAVGNAAQAQEALVSVGVDDVGIPHSAPDDVDGVNPALIRELLAVSIHERWRVAKRWAGSDGRQPNKEKLAATKKLLNSLCDLAERAARSGKYLVLIPDGLGT